MRKVFLFIAFLVVGCSSAQYIESANKDDLKNQQAQTELEKDRSKDLYEFINRLSISDADKDWIKKQIEYKDRQLILKDAALAKHIKENIGYQKHASEENKKCENKQDEFIAKQEKCLIEAGYGRVLKWLLILISVAAGIYVLYLVIVKLFPQLPLSVKDFITGKKN